MELRSGHRLRRSSPPPSHPHGTRSRRMDLVSALPDEVLLLVLARLRCIRTAAQTSLLSRRWRALWTGPTDLTFRGLVPATIQALFHRFATASPQVSTLDIGLPWSRHGTAGAGSLLRAAVRLSPRHLILNVKELYPGHMGNIELPCFERATSIDIDVGHTWLQPLPDGEFTALESLSITGQIISIGPLLIRCPRLRVLSLTYSDRYIIHIPHGEFPALEKLSLSALRVNTGSLLNNCQRLRVLSVTHLHTCPLRIMLPPSGQFPMLEKLNLSGNITDLGILLNRCPRLHVIGVTFCGMGLHSLIQALATLQKVVPLGLVLSTLGIEIPWRDGISSARFASLLRTMERLSPQELVVTDNFEGSHSSGRAQEIKANLPCFANTTSIEMSPRNVSFKSLKPSEFSRLERLSLSSLCSTVEIGTLVTRCPRLRVLKVAVSTGKMTVHSASLQKLDVNWNVGECHGIDIVTPMLKKLHVNARAGGDISVSISAQVVQDVSWQCWYTRSALVFGSWCVQSLRVQTMENVMCLHLNADPLPAGEFTALESLSVTGQINDLGPLLIRCRRLRELSLTYRDKYALLIPHEHGEFPALEKLSLSGKMVNHDSLISSSKSLRELSVTQLDTCPLRIMLPPSREFQMLEKLTLSGNIADLGILLNGCPRLHVLSVTLRGMRIHSLKAALATLQKAVSLGLVLSTLGVEIQWRDDISAARFASLLRTMERLSPQELVVNANLEGRYTSEHFHEIKANLPCFTHATSIEMSLQNVCFKSLKPGDFSILERLSISRLCSSVDIGTLVTRFTHLRVLKVTVSTGKMMIHSALLQKLDVEWNSGMKCHGIDIVTPMLKQLHVEVHAEWDIGVSISAPMVDNVSWQCSYAGSALVFGSWYLHSFRVQTMKNVMCLHLNANVCIYMSLLNLQFDLQTKFYDVQCMISCPNVLQSQRDAKLNFAHELEKLPVTNFSMLEINFDAAWHVYGALVLQLLQMRRIRVATKKLKVNLPWWPKAKQACPQNCHCDEPTNWRRQSIFCTSLEEVEIRGFNGEDHEHDFLRLILKCSPMLKRVIVQASEVFRGHATELSNIYMAHPFVKFYK
ncbi:hypothetical protein ACQ4PT_041618 [Festuca glaucescens]